MDFLTKRHLPIYLSQDENWFNCTWDRMSQNHIQKNHISAGICAILCACMFRIWGAGTVEAYDYTHYFNQYDIEVLRSNTVETTYPAWAKPNPEQDKKDVSYRVNEVLQDENAKSADMYIVYPTHGIVIPVREPNETDFKLIQQGEDFNHYKYLEKWALHHFWAHPAVEKGNIVIAAHSSFTKSSPWTYKTVGQAFIISRPGEKIFLYTKTDAGDFDLFEYTITASYETSKYNVSILPYKNDGKSYLTTYACFKIGSNKDRRVNEAVLETTSRHQSRLDGAMHGSAPTEDIVFTTQTVKSRSLLGTTTTNIEIKKIWWKEFRRKIKRLAPLASGSGSSHTGTSATGKVSVNSGSTTIKKWPEFPQEFLASYSKKLDRMAVMVAYRAKFVHPLLQRIMSMFEKKAAHEVSAHKKMAYTYIARKLSQYISETSAQ